MMPGEFIETTITRRVREVLEKHAHGELPDTAGFIATDSLGEVIEKLVILHIRMWMIEDRIQEVNADDARVADLKRRLDICLKQKRPKLVEAVNRLVDAAIRDSKSLLEDDVKLYAGPKP